MKRKNRLLPLLLLLTSAFAHAQLDSYAYKRPLHGVANKWHTIELPDSIFGKLNADLSDLRIYGVTKTDTLEAPFLLKVSSADLLKSEINFKMLNRSSNNNGHYITYELLSKEVINKIHLNIEDENFDWLLRLEGSNDQQNWFTILEDYRIVSISNNQTNYSYTDLVFPSSKFNFYRVLINSKKQPKIKGATLSLDHRKAAEYITYPTKKFKAENGDHNQTTLEVELFQKIPISLIKFDVKNTVDYYRSLTIAYVADSVETDKGWKYNYRSLTSGTLNSVEDNEFQFNSTLIKKIWVLVRNNDNQPLEFNGVILKGYKYRLKARFDQPAEYFLAYGKPLDQHPKYDISKNMAKIPEDMLSLSLGKETVIPKKETTTSSPLFENKLWLWAVMGIVIVVIGAFTLKMMRSPKL